MTLALALMAIGSGLVGALLFWAVVRGWRYVQFRRRKPAQTFGYRYAVTHALKNDRRLYHESNDLSAARAHYYANNAPAGASVEFWIDGACRGQRNA